MRHTYCPHCGSQLIPKVIGDEGEIPYCLHCQIPVWDSFTTCIICAVVNEYGEVALLRQNYVSTTYYVLVAGVMKPGESAEDAARREVLEEIGQSVDELTYVRSYPFQKKDMLMLGFRAQVKKQALKLSGEVDGAVWVPLEQASTLLRNGSIAWQLVQAVR